MELFSKRSCTQMKKKSEANLWYSKYLTTSFVKWPDVFFKGEVIWQSY